MVSTQTVFVNWKEGPALVAQQHLDYNHEYLYTYEHKIFMYSLEKIETFIYFPAL